MQTLTKHSKGITLLEALLAIGVLSIIFVGVGYFSLADSKEKQMRVIGEQLRNIGYVSQKYINENSADLISIATATQPAVIPISALRDYAPGLRTTNSFLQNQCILVLQPTAGYLQAMVVTEGGEPINDIALGGMMRTLGANGGGIYSSDVNNIVGAQGGWSIPIGNFANAKVKCSDGSTSGSIKLEKGHAVYALWFKTSSTGVNTQVLYRNNVAGHPELATMNTPIIMNAVQSLGSSCNTQGAIANLNDGTPVSCSSGKWRRSIATESSSSCFNIDVNGNTTMACGKAIIENRNNKGTVRLLDNNGNTIYMQNNNGKWRLIANDGNTTLMEVDQSGNLQNKGWIKPGEGLIIPTDKRIVSDGNLLLQSTGKGTTLVYGQGEKVYADNNNYGMYVYGNNKANAAKKDVDGSINVNDTYFRSIGKWASEIWDTANK